MNREEEGLRLRKVEIASCEIIAEVQFIHCYIFKMSIIEILIT